MANDNALILPFAPTHHHAKIAYKSSVCAKKALIFAVFTTKLFRHFVATRGLSVGEKKPPIKRVFLPVLDTVSR